MKQLVLDFYREVYQENIICNDKFLTILNSNFNHPVVTPNFLLEDSVTVEDFERNQKIFKARGLKYWVNAFEENERNIETFSLKKQSSCNFLFYESPPKSEGYDFYFSDFDNLSLEQQELSNKGLSQSSHNLDLLVLEKIEKVIKGSKGKFQKFVAMDKNRKIPIAGVSFLQGTSSGLLLNAWVHSDFRRKGILNEMVNQVTTPFFESGAKLVFAWTYNPILLDKGDSRVSLGIYHST